MKRWFWRAVGLGIALALGGFLLSTSGLVTITARSGHWPVTRWFLEYSKRRSVGLHSFGTKVPQLDDAALILKGAGPYAINCSGCHGSPGRPHPRVARAMTPQPPNLGETAPTWDSEDLHYIIKNGIKFTGMPAWPAPQRDDEVWALVAFVRALPGMTVEEYRRLAFGRESDPAADHAAPEEELNPPPGIRNVVTESCVRCHGRDGNGRGQPAFPRLAGQRERYLLASLAAYARGARHSGIMAPVAYGLDADTQRELARYYASLPPATPAPADHDEAAIERGRLIAERGEPSRRLPSCLDCHSTSGSRHRPVYPDLAGQPADYLAQQLKLFQSGARGGSEFAHLMEHIAPRLTAEQIDDVTRYFASLPPGADSAAPNPEVP